MNIQTVKQPQYFPVAAESYTDNTTNTGIQNLSVFGTNQVTNIQHSLSVAPQVPRPPNPLPLPLPTSFKPC